MTTVSTSANASNQSPDEVLRKIADQLPGVVYQFRLRPDGSSHFPYASRALVDIYRVSPEAAGLDAGIVFKAIHPDDYEQVVESIAQSALGLSPWQHEYRVKFDDGEVRWLYGNALPEREADGCTLWHGFITDITAKKESDAVALRTLARLTATLNALPDLMFELSLAGKYLYVHALQSDLLLNPAQALMGSYVRDVLPAKASAIVMAALQEAQASGYSSGKIYSLPLAKGETWFELSISRKATELGEEVRFIVLSRDISERILAQEKDFISGLALNAISQGVLISNPQGLLISVNERFKLITGFDEAEILGKTCAFLQGPLTDKKVIAAMRCAALRKSEFKGKILNYRKDGSTFWNDLSITPIFDTQGEVLHFVGVTQDITQQQLAEVEIKRSNTEEHRLNRSLRMLSQCDKLIVQADNNRQLLQDLCQVICQKGYYVMAWAGLARTGDEPLLEPVALYSKKNLELRGIKAAWAAEQASGLGPTVMAMQTARTQLITTQWGDPAHALWLNSPQKQGPHAALSLPLLHDGQLLGVLVIHARKSDAFSGSEVLLLNDLARNVANGLNTLRIRHELVRHQVKLEELVVERTQEIEVLNEDLVQKREAADAASRVKSDFLSNMSHELRTPLNAVIGLTELLTQSPLNRRQLDYAEKIQLSANTLRTLIDDVLDLSKIEADELQLEKAPYALHDLLNNTASVMGLSVGHKPIEPVLLIFQDVPKHVFGDALRVQQILLNLISNAVKFTEAGEIVLSVRYLSESNERGEPQDRLIFCVRDTGIGMTQETQKVIFNSFTQANESTSRLYGGTGLGLAISTRLATLMQGQLEVDSVLGEGTTFCLTLPVSPVHQAPADTLGDGHGFGTLTPADLKILIVDDHALVRDLLTQTCHGLGWQAEAVDSGPAALQALLKNATDVHAFDLLLLDWHMPDMDGLATLREAYKSPDLDLPPVVLMVATAEIEQAVTVSAEFNIDAILPKPLTPSSLRQAVNKALMADTPAVDLKPLAHPQPLEGLHLLVVEDNELNREVMEQILHNAGAQVTLAINGQMALDALQVRGVHFNAVLMDIQMPVMDGYTATRHIRDNLGLVNLPIIALTAHARPQDRDISRLAGMSAHLVKPLDVQALLEVVAKVASPRTPVPQVAAKSGPMAKLVLPGLNVAQAVQMFGGHHERYGQLLHKFVAQHSPDVEEARRRFSTGNAQGAMLLMHNISGVAGFLQAPALSRLAASAESAMQDERSDQLFVLFDELQAAMDTVKSSLAQFDAAMA